MMVGQSPVDGHTISTSGRESGQHAAALTFNGSAAAFIVVSSKIGRVVGGAHESLIWPSGNRGQKSSDINGQRFH
jgi:hypothetical protein